MTRIPFLFALCAVLATPVVAADETFKLGELTCFEVLSLPEDDSLFLTGMLVGAAMGEDELSPEAIKSAVEMLDATCGENPDMIAMDALS